MALGSCGGSPSSGPLNKMCKSVKLGSMVRIPAGSFMMGEDPRYEEEGPSQKIYVKGFWIDAHEVTNTQFEAFVDSTGYKTLAERTPPVLPNASSEMLLPGSAVFAAPSGDDQRWWKWAVGAQWRHPARPDETISGRGRDPVVQVAYEDAEAYAKWVGKELPTEAQWEYAARAGQPSAPEPVDTEGRPQANYYQGAFPVRDLGTDGFKTRAPVGCFKANAYGLYDTIGNVWEWTRKIDASSDDIGVIKGGSYLCAANYCARYRPAARQFQERALGTNHIGFRLVRNDTGPSQR